MATASHQKKIAENGDIVVPGDKGIAVRAHGTGMNYRFGGRQSVNTNVQKTSDAKTHQEDENFYQIRGHA